MTSQVIRDPRINFVSFTGSVATGRLVSKAASESRSFTGVSLEVSELLSVNGHEPIPDPQLGGKDPAYVREDADVGYTAAELVDGWFMCLTEDVTE